MITRSAAALAVLLLLGACAQKASGGGGGDTPSAYAPDQLVLRVAYTGGFVTPQMLISRLPLVSVYGDGRVLTEGPTPAIYPGPALPNVQVGHIEQSDVQDLVDAALDAGVGETDDLGTPPIADAPSTLITVSTGLESLEREVYALQETPAEGTGLTADQVAAREKLSGLVDRLTGLSAGASESYTPSSVATLAAAYTPPDDPQLVQPDQAWPGPALPGEPLPGPFGFSCAVASGDQAAAVLAAAGTANALTPWVGSDGARWSVSFRPLLPDESGCADLA
ncbi:hypothetical protein [Petropleomorpha daqingensis]|uniref:Uncharacterized protein n=1 Tax=Petropleomorpha daqingensis TaxID=2026353 RepID=A0A853C922_9ACTN|nr:hypothetical protein [Petropleomorpha daqingensis]NYJ04415.1 hypothetical protein [Petropleomorpha daqingensis]